MFKHAGNTLKSHFRSLNYSYSSTPLRHGGLNGVTLSVISTAIAGTALWCLNKENVYNDAARPSIVLEKEKAQAPGIIGTPSDPNTVYSWVWGSNRSVSW